MLWARVMRGVNSIESDAIFFALSPSTTFGSIAKGSMSAITLDPSGRVETSSASGPRTLKTMSAPWTAAAASFAMDAPASS